jgi:hypothetical protein
MPDNIFPDRSNSQFDIKYNQLKILASDIRSRLFNRGVVVSTPQTGSSGGDDTPIPPGDSGCKKVYVANLSQSGTANPVASVFENTIGPIVWTRVSTGIYRGTLTDAFTIDGTWVMVDTNYLKALDNKQVKFNVTANNDYVEIQTESGGALANDILDHTSIEIRTYCVSGDGACTDVSIGEFSLSDAFVGVDYLVSIPLTGTPPFVLNVTSKPAWMTIDIIDGALTFSGTPTEEAGPAEVNLTITNCSAGLGEIGTFISVSTPVATFDYTNILATHDYCQALSSNPSPLPNPTPNFTGGGMAGVFTATAGLVFVDGSPSPTGQVDITATPPGAYTVTNTVGAVVATADINVLPLPAGTINYDDDTFCTTDGLQDVTITAPGTFSGSFSASPSGLSINSSTGQIDPSSSTPGTYVVTFIYLSLSNGCPNSTTTNITIEVC